MLIANFIGQPFRRKNLNECTSGKKRSEKVIGRAQRYFKVRIILTSSYLALAFMEWQIPHSFCFYIEGANDYLLHGNIRLSDDSVAVTEPCCGIEIFVVFK